MSKDDLLAWLPNQIDLPEFSVGSEQILPVTIPPGFSQVGFVINPTRDAPDDETTFDNNYCLLELAKKNLAVQNLRLSPNPANAGGSVTATAEVINQWPLDQPTKVRWSVNGVVQKEEDVVVPA